MLWYAHRIHHSRCPLLQHTTMVITCPTFHHSWIVLQTCSYIQPTAIQAQALPAVLSGRDVLVGWLHC